MLGHNLENIIALSSGKLKFTCMLTAIATEVLHNNIVYIEIEKKYMNRLHTFTRIGTRGQTGQTAI